MSETQLERSVLEAKERDELFAIADALGAKPAARAKKADLVTQILRATGIEASPGDAVADGAEKPKRTRARKATAATVTATADATSAAGSASPATAEETAAPGRSAGPADSATQAARTE